MWLLNASTYPYQLEEFTGNIPPYAILSHTWGEEEVSFQDLTEKRPGILEKKGFWKIEKCCLQAREDGLNYTWVDTCCIDKRSSAELSEAINSMFKWYERSKVCYVYLTDVPLGGLSLTEDARDTFSQSRWFTRGWTLQELIAPRFTRFYSQDWSFLCHLDRRIYSESGQNEATDGYLLRKLSTITDIPEPVFQTTSGSRSLDKYPIARRFSWAARRITTREEDIAYCLMGIARTNIPILYGEGRARAFRRLQHEIMRENLDLSIFMWTSTFPDLQSSECLVGPVIASEPSFFHGYGVKTARLPLDENRPFSITNAGIAIRLPMIPLEIKLRKLRGGDLLELDAYFGILQMGWQFGGLRGIYLVRDGSTPQMQSDVQRWCYQRILLDKTQYSPQDWPRRPGEDVVERDIYLVGKYLKITKIQTTYGHQYDDAPYPTSPGIDGGSFEEIPGP